MIAIATGGHAGLGLYGDWPGQWTVTWRAGRDEQSYPVRGLVRSSALHGDPVRGFTWRRAQRHRPGLRLMVSTGRHHGAESLEEARVLLALDFAAEVVDVVSQPFRPHFHTARRRVHTPDFLVVKRSGTWLVDVRPEPLIGDDDRESFAATAELAVA